MVKVRAAFADLPRWGDFGAVAMVRALVGLVIVGGRRLRHIAHVADDPVFRRFGTVRVVPTAQTLSGVVAQIDSAPRRLTL